MGTPPWWMGCPRTRPDQIRERSEPKRKRKNRNRWLSSLSIPARGLRCETTLRILGAPPMTPEIKYALSGDVHIAYQIVGNGPTDLVYVPGFTSHIGYAWESPFLAHFLERLGTFSRLIWFDKRGTGMSDRVTIATLEQRMDDV